jgi:hypothetical protein
MSDGSLSLWKMHRTNAHPFWFGRGIDAKILAKYWEGAGNLLLSCCMLYIETFDYS